MELKLRRWSGQTSGGRRETRLVVRDVGADARVGHIQVDTGWLFVEHEPDREAVLRALAELGVEVVGPPIEGLAAMPFLQDVYCASGTQSRIKLMSKIGLDGGDQNIGWLGEDRYDLTTGARLPPVHVGELHLEPGALSVSHPDWWDDAVGHLRRLGALAVEQVPEELTDALVYQLNGWTPTVEDEGGDEFVEDEDYDAAPPSFFGRPLPQWSPGQLSSTELATLRASTAEFHAPIQARDSGRRLTSYAEDLLEPDLVPLLAFVLRQDDNGITGADPRGYYREWVKPKRWRTPDWQYDACGMKGRLDDRHFTPEFEDWLSEHKSAFGGAWATVAAYDAEYDFPDLWREAHEWVRQALAEDEYLGLTMLPGIDRVRSGTVEWVASRLWRRQRKQPRDWSVLGTIECPVCGGKFQASGLDPTQVFAPLGPPRWCSVCCWSTWGVQNAYGTPDFPLTLDLAVQALRHLAAVQGFAPAPKWHLARIPRGLSETQRDRLVLARMAMPRTQELRLLRPDWVWVDWLREAGLVGDTMRTARGTMCTASDGHPCRSMLELAIDDYLTAAGLAHECEPEWPWHAQFNPSGRRRADWRLEDGTLIEAAGLLGQEAYDAKMAEKVQLAAALGIRLIVLTPDDLPRLPELLSAEVAIGT